MVLNKKNLKRLIIVFCISFLLLSFLIAIIVGFTYQISFLYSYLINSGFIILMVLIITICENKIVNHFLEEKQELFLKKSYLIFLWKIKYLPVLLLLICTMVLTTQKM